MERVVEKAGVGFGRTELSLRAIGTTLCALSSVWAWSQGSGFSRGFARDGFSCFMGAGTRGVKIDKIRRVFLKNLGSDLVVQSSR